MPSWGKNAVPCQRPIMAMERCSSMYRPSYRPHLSSYRTQPNFKVLSDLADVKQNPWLFCSPWRWPRGTAPASRAYLATFRAQSSRRPRAKHPQPPHMPPAGHPAGLSMWRSGVDVPLPGNRRFRRKNGSVSIRGTLDKPASSHPPAPRRGGSASGLGGFAWLGTWPFAQRAATGPAHGPMYRAQVVVAAVPSATSSARISITHDAVLACHRHSSCAP